MNVYEIVADRIMKELAKGVVPWQKPWATHADRRPVNISGRPYNGVNRILLGMGGFSSPFFATFNQIRKAGGTVRKGEHGTPVVFFKVSERTNAVGDVEKFPLFRYTTAFNAEQCDGLIIPESIKQKFDPKLEAAAPAQKIAAAQAIVDHMPNRPTLNIVDGGAAFYKPSTDTVTVPSLGQYTEDLAGEFYSTMFHELGHSTGHESRLNREEISNPHKFTSHTYGVEELTAELTSAFLCSEAGIDNTLKNSAAYIGNWMNIIMESPRIIVQASSRAQKAADYILGTAQN